MRKVETNMRVTNKSEENVYKSEETGNQMRLIETYLRKRETNLRKLKLHSESIFGRYWVPII